MTTAIVIFAIVYVLIASGRVHHVLVVAIGAALMVLLQVVEGDQLLGHVDLNVIILLASMMTLADIIARTGAFEWIAIKSVHLARGSGFGLLVLLALITAVASAFLDNVTTVVLMVPITLSLCKRLDLRPTPFLLGEVFASNIGGAATVVGDPPNIIVASAAEISFLPFMLNMAPISILGMALLFPLLFVWFRKEVIVSPEKRQEMLTMSAADVIRDVPLLRKSIIVFGFTIVGFLVHDLLHTGPAFIALAGAGALLLISGLQPRSVLREIEWTSLMFFVGLFILVGGLVETGAIDEIRMWMTDVSDGKDSALALLLIWLGGGASAIVDNIPYTATTVKAVEQIPSVEASEGTNPLWWALTLGADFGGNFTIIGASANVVVISTARARGVEIGFWEFAKYGAVITVGTLLIATGYLWLRFFV